MIGEGVRPTKITNVIAMVLGAFHEHSQIARPGGYCG
jgi:hypothetical protein